MQLLLLVTTLEGTSKRVFELVVWFVSWKKWAQVALLGTKWPIYSECESLWLVRAKFVHFGSAYFSFRAHFIMAIGMQKIASKLRLMWAWMSCVRGRVCVVFAQYISLWYFL